MKKEKFIGAFSVGPTNIRLYFGSVGGGNFTMLPEDGGTAKIVVDPPKKIGVSKFFDVLLHELYEFAMSSLMLRMCVSPGYSRSHADYMFVMTHEQFGEVSARVADAMCNILAALLKKGLITL